MRWVQRARETSRLMPLAKAGGWHSPVELPLRHRLVPEQPDRPTDELTRAYNRAATPAARVLRSRILRALQRTGYVFNKNDRARRNTIVPPVQAARAAFRQWIERIDPQRLVFVDESGANLARGRSHAWLPRGTVLAESRPMTWGDTVTLVGAVRVARGLTLATSWGAMHTVRLVAWVRRHLVRHLRPGDVVVMDNLAAHQARQVRELIERAGATV